MSHGLHESDFVEYVSFLAFKEESGLDDIKRGNPQYKELSPVQQWVNLSMHEKIYYKKLAASIVHRWLDEILEDKSLCYIPNLDSRPVSV